MKTKSPLFLAIFLFDSNIHSSTSFEILWERTANVSCASPRFLVGCRRISQSWIDSSSSRSISLSPILTALVFYQFAASASLLSSSKSAHPESTKMDWFAEAIARDCMRRWMSAGTCGLACLAGFTSAIQSSIADLCLWTILKKAVMPVALNLFLDGLRYSLFCSLDD